MKPFPQIPLVFFCIVLFLHCGNNKQNPGNKELVVAYVSNLGKGQFLYSIKNSITTTFEVNDKEYSTSNSANLDFNYTLQKDSAGNNQLTITYDQINVSLKDKDNNLTELSSTKADYSTDPVERILGTIKGGSLLITMDSSRNIKHITGIKELSDKVLKSLPSQDAFVQDKVKNLVLKLIGEEFVRNNLQQTFQLLPDSAIKVGQTWNRTIKAPGDINMDAESIYKLQDIQNGIAQVKANSHFKGEERNTIMVMGRPAVLENLKGDQEEKFSIDLETGMLTKSTSSTHISGSILVLTNQVPLTITSTKEITGKKISEK